MPHQDALAAAAVPQGTEGALQITYRKPGELIPYSRNARTHSPDQVAQIAASIAEFGFTNPILVGADGVIIAGHGRLAAAQSLGLEQVPVVALEHLTEAQRRAYVIADNKLAEQAGWDKELLALELGALLDMDFDATQTGFGEDEIAAILHAAEKTRGLTDEDEAPAAEEQSVSQPGDVWQLGAHRVRCGDSTCGQDVEALLQGVQPPLMVTDPPYGVSYDANWRNEAERANGKPVGGRAIGKVANDECADWRSAWELFPGDVAYVWHAGNKAHIVADSLEACGFTMRAQIIWAKNNIAIGRGHYHWKHEPCWYAVRNHGHWQGSRNESSLWEIDKPVKSETGHSTQKPVECMRRPILNNSAVGQPVYDPFLGSGTTLIAAHTEGRICYGMELMPAYVDVIIRRWQAFTGLAAVHVESGRSFDELAVERLEVADVG